MLPLWVVVNEIFLTDFMHKYVSFSITGSFSKIILNYLALLDRTLRKSPGEPLL